MVAKLNAKEYLSVGISALRNVESVLATYSMATVKANALKLIFVDMNVKVDAI
jgi:hypothetical protein